MGRKAGVDYRFCDKCSSAFQHPIFSETEYQRFYEKVQKSDETGYRSTKVPRFHLRRKIADTKFKWRQLSLLDIDGLVPGKRVFEIGPGEGTLLASFRRRGYTVRGIEPFTLHGDHARDVFKLDVIDGYFDASVAAREKADLVILDNVLEHFTTPFEMLRLVRQVLPLGSILYIAVPCVETVLPENAHIAHIVLWSRRALAFVLECAGFQVLDMIKGRPGSRPHEWVCLSQAVGEPRDIESATPRLFSPLCFEKVSADWQAGVARYNRALARQEKYGPGYQALVRIVRAVPGARRALRRFV